ncbi:hypothetical protein DCS_02021 [Drechmeria coniospora]|uniref:Uncharacterized protein n=1 Tax=Drechmeria coniospora TaxID=98403 RepID=A0A151GV28_DRECN|nr:hypothetical protein DCS_02021 [Drechmeria coniospora]KYK60882.1 hypothetical protein DCS_02021 [Drechmeria coniospora]
MADPTAPTLGMAIRTRLYWHMRRWRAGDAQHTHCVRSRRSRLRVPRGGRLARRSVLGLRQASVSWRSPIGTRAVVALFRRSSADEGYSAQQVLLGALNAAVVGADCARSRLGIASSFAPKKGKPHRSIVVAVGVGSPPASLRRKASHVAQSLRPLVSGRLQLRSEERQATSLDRCSRGYRIATSFAPNKGRQHSSTVAAVTIGSPTSLDRGGRSHRSPSLPGYCAFRSRSATTTPCLHHPDHLPRRQRTVGCGGSTQASALGVHLEQVAIGDVGHPAPPGRRPIVALVVEEIRHQLLHDLVKFVVAALDGRPRTTLGILQASERNMTLEGGEQTRYGWQAVGRDPRRFLLKGDGRYRDGEQASSKRLQDDLGGIGEGQGGIVGESQAVAVFNLAAEALQRRRNSTHDDGFREIPPIGRTSRGDGGEEKGAGTLHVGSWLERLQGVVTTRAFALHSQASTVQYMQYVQ